MTRQFIEESMEKRHDPVSDVGVVHGRFQVLHNDHLKYIMAGKARCEHLVVGITNPDPTLVRHDPADPERSTPGANPLTYFERYQTVREVLAGEGLEYGQFSIVPFPISLPELYHHYVPMEATFYLTIYDDWGRRKLERFRSLGLRTEVLWEKPQWEKGLRASDIRRRMAAGEPWEHLVPPLVGVIMKRLDVPSRLQKIYTG